MKKKLFKLSLLSIILLLGIQNTIAQKIDVSGKVTDTGGDPLPGVTIVIDGTSDGMVTDSDGNYSFYGLAPDATLIFSFVGMKTQKILVNGQTVINVTMEVDAIGLEEVVAIGYGTQMKSDITGSVASVKAETLEKLPATRIDQAIQGQLSGVLVQTTTAEPNSKITIRIRGANSINGGNDPLIVIDGFQGGDLSTLNPADVESVETLKDASATAVYGSRGANGVIIVTTKSGKKGKPKFSYSSQIGIAQVRKKMDLLNAAQYAETVNAQRTETGLSPIFSASEIDGFRRNGGTNWQDEIFRIALDQSHNLSVNGGNENVSYYISGNLVDREGIVLNTSYKRYSLRSNVKTKLNEKLDLNLNVLINSEEDHPTALNSFGPGNGGSPIFSSLIFAPTKPVREDNGKYSLPGGGYGPPSNFNPVALAQEPVRDHLSNMISVNGAVNYKIIKDLQLNISGGYRSNDFENSEYLNGEPTGQPGTESASIFDGRNLTLQNTNRLTYTKELNAHKFVVTTVYEQQYEKYNENWSGSNGFLTNSLTYNNLSLGKSPAVPSSYITERSLLSYMGRINYTYKSKYLLTVTGRADASSVFGKDNKWGYFPSVAAGWNITEENFMGEVKNTISQFKLRASYGIVGNQAISPYQSLASLSINAYPVNGISLSPAIQLGGLSNTDLKWEKTAQLNIGTDIKLLDGRIEFIGDYYDKKTSDLLLVVPLPASAGGNGSVLRNIGEVGNKGIELFLGGKPFVGNFKWETGFTFSINKNEVLELSGDETAIPIGGGFLPGLNNTFWLIEGEPLGTFHGLRYDGVWKTSESAEAEKYGAFPGAPKFYDKNGDYIFNGDDEVILGNAQPDFSYGWNNTFSYKNIDLNIFIQGVYGNDIYNAGRVRAEFPSGDSDPTLVSVLDRWTPQNEDSNIPSFAGQAAFFQLNSSRWIEDGSYLRIKNISLGYTLPKSIVQKLGIGSARLSLSGTNLFTLTKYSGYDPEATVSVDRFLGVDLATYPSQKTYFFGIDINF